MSYLDEQIDTVEEPVVALESLRFLQTQPHRCSYLPDQEAATVFVNPQQRVDRALYSQLSAYGFRRSGNHIYKPFCQQCRACVPLRIPVADFTPKRQQRRTWKRNADLVVSQVASIDTDEHYQLYQDYIETKHADGDMYPPSREHFRSFVASDWPSSHYYEFRLEGRLVATSVADLMDNGISAIYSYYDTREHKRSLGSFIILYLIEQSRKYALPSLYLGYWIKDSSKMAYKSQYRPLEIQHGDQWLRVV